MWILGLKGLIGGNRYRVNLVFPFQDVYYYHLLFFIRLNKLECVFHIYMFFLFLYALSVSGCT